MGIKDDQARRNNAQSDNGASQQQQANPGFRAAAPEQPQAQTTATGAPQFSFSELGRKNRGILGKNPASEILTKLTKGLQELYGEGDQSYGVKLLPIDLNNNRLLPLSALAVCVQDKQLPELGVAVHILMLEGSAEPFQPLYEQVGNVNIEKLRVASDAYSADVIDAVFAEVQRAFPNTMLLDASGCVVRRGFNVEDKALLHTLGANASKATTTLLNTARPDFADINLAGAEKDTTLGIRTLFNQQEIQDAVGNPVRADVVIDLNATSNTSQNRAQGVSPMDRTVGISRATGFVEPIWAPVQQQQVQNIYQPQVAQNKQVYMARFVMTSLETGDLLTIPAQLLALAVAATLRESNGHFPAFQKKGRGSDIQNWHDIGAVNIEANLANEPGNVGSKIKDTQLDSFGLAELGQLVAATFQPGLVMSLDVSECGADTWHNDVFAAAAEGSEGANNSIIDGAMILTNGNFSKHFPVGTPICTDEYNRIHMGTVDTKDGLRDVREFDYLAALNLLGEKDPSIIRQWSDSFNRTDFSLDSRLAARKKILTGVFGDSVVFTGFARRVTFTDAFINALLMGIRATGIQIRNTTPVADMGTYERVGYNVSGVLGGGAASGLFTFGQQAGAGYAGNRQAGFGRWAR